MSPEAREKIAAAQRLRWRLSKQKVSRASKGGSRSTRRLDIKLADVLRLRKQGLNLDQIGEQLGCSPSKLSRVLHDGASANKNGRPPDGRSHAWTPERRQAKAEAMRKRYANPKQRKALLKRMEAMRAAKLRAKLLAEGQAGKEGGQA